MSDLPNQPVKSPFRRPAMFSAILALCAAGYLGFIVFTRWDSDRTLEKRNAAKAAEERRAKDLSAIQGLGGSELSIRALYLSPPAIYAGDKSQLCYDVANAKIVTVNPPIGEVWPSHTRCLDISPAKTTTYTLTITGAHGQSTSQSVELKVTKRPPIRVKPLASQ